MMNIRTPASTGLLQYEIDKPLFVLTELVGEKHAARSYPFCLGITFSQVAAEIIRDLAIGQKNNDAKIFPFDRSK